jgi:hypothetical protein
MSAVSTEAKKIPERGRERRRNKERRRGRDRRRPARKKNW